MKGETKRKGGGGEGREREGGRDLSERAEVRAENVLTQEVFKIVFGRVEVRVLRRRGTA